MRQLARADVLRAAIIAAAFSTMACLPRVCFWSARRYPVWYLESVLFLGAIVLWAFVFAWHTRYSGRPVIRLRIEPWLFLLATGVGLGAAIGLLRLLDPMFQKVAPEDYPRTFSQWFAMVLFSLAFTELFLVFAPCAWLMRLFQNKAITTTLTIVFGLCVIILKNRSSATPMSGDLLSRLLMLRAVSSMFALYFYWRGGVILAWWFNLLVLSRHLAPLWGNP